MRRLQFRNTACKCVGAVRSLVCPPKPRRDSRAAAEAAAVEILAFGIPPYKSDRNTSARLFTSTGFTLPSELLANTRHRRQHLRLLHENYNVKT